MSVQKYSIEGENPDFVVEADYVVADMHFNHANIVDPDSRVDCRSDDLQRLMSQESVSVRDMNEYLVEEWNQRVSESDRVVILGDFNLGHSPDDPDRIYGSLNGQKTYVMGDHDIRNGKLDIPSQAEPENHDDLNYWGIVETGESAYLATHYPDENPRGVPGGDIDPRIEANLPENLYEEWDGRIIHGHHHNNWLDDNDFDADYPLVHPEGRSNVGVELTDYGPFDVETLDNWFENGMRVESASRTGSGQ